MGVCEEAIEHSAVRSAHEIGLPAAFQTASSCRQRRCPPELCDADGPAVRAVQAAIIVAGAERDERRFAHRLTDEDIRTAHTVLGAADEVWRRRDAAMLSRHPKSVSNFRILDAVFIGRRSLRDISKELDLTLKTIQDRYDGALTAVERAFGDLCVGCDSLSPSDGVYNGISWKDRLRQIEAAETAGPGRKREYHPSTKPLRTKSLPRINIWRGLSKSQIRDCAEALVASYLANGGTVTQCRPGLNYMAESYWLLPRAARKHHADVRATSAAATSRGNSSPRCSMMRAWSQ